MKKRIYRFFRRLKLRLYIWARSRNMVPSYQDDVESYEKTFFLICTKTIGHKDSEFMIAPVSNKRYIKNDTLSLFITISNNRVDLTNHVYHYSVKLNGRDWERLLFIFDKETDKRIIEYETTINSQIQNSLSKVLEKISKIKQM